MNLDKPFRTGSFLWSMSWYMILLGTALLFIPNRFGLGADMSQSTMSWLGTSLTVVGLLNYVFLLFNVSDVLMAIKKSLYLISGALFAILAWYLILDSSDLRVAGLPLLILAIISTILPFLRKRKRQKDFFDISIINLASIAFLLGLAAIFLPMNMLNFDILNINSFYVKSLGFFDILISGLLIAVQLKKLSFTRQFLIHLLAVLSLLLTVFPSLINPQLTSLEFVTVFLFTSSLTLFWNPEKIQGTWNSLQIQILVIMMGTAFILTFLFIVITGQSNIGPFSWIIFAFGTAMTASILTTVVAKPLSILRKATRQLQQKDHEFTPIETVAPDEIRALIKNFNHMALKMIESKSVLQSQIEEKSKDLKESKANLSQLLTRLKAILESTEEPLVAVNPEGKIIIFNNSISRLTGFPIKQALGNQITKLLVLKDSEMKKVPDVRYPTVIATKERRTVVNRFDEHFYLIDINGNNIPITFTSSPVTGPHNNIMGAIGVIRDISLEKRLKDLQNEFVFVAAHELRNPVTAITGFVEYAREAKVRNKKVRDALSAIDEANTRLRLLINNLLQIARFESGQIQPTIEKVDVNQLIKKIIKEQNDEIKTKSLKVEIVEDRNAKGKFVRTDPGFLREVLTNLIRNAVKYTDKKGKITANLLLSDKKRSSTLVKSATPKYMVIKITDTGAGIPKAEQPKIFEKFYRASNVASRIDGNGLGLFIVRKLVKRMQGDIWFESEENKGSTFYISVPLVL